MRSNVTIRPMPRVRGLRSFSLIELLTVMAIIAILASLILVAGNGVIIKAERSRASAEVQAMTAGLEGYKTDNGIYAVSSQSGLVTTTYNTVDAAGAAGLYQQSSQALYQALSGQVNFLDTTIAGKSYMSFKANQLGNTTTAANTGSSAATATYVKDPFGTSYGYSTGYVSGATTNYPYNGNGFFDLWSTGGVTYTQLTATSTLTNAWISNWQ